MKRLTMTMLLACAGSISACAVHTAEDSGPTPAPMFNLSVTDNAELQRFELLLRSSDNRPLCMDVEQWPNQLGQVDWHGRRGVLHSQEGSFSAEDANFGFCPGGCGVIKIAPGGEHRGFIPYSEFGDPKAIVRLQDRHLDFTVVPRVCAGEEKIISTHERQHAAQ